MHILIVMSNYRSVQDPLANGLFHEQALALHRAGHQVGVISAPRIEVTLSKLRQMRRLSDLQMSLDVIDGLPVYRMHWGWFPARFRRIRDAFYALAAQQASARYCREQGRPDVLHANNLLYGGYLATTIKARFEIPVVLLEHDSRHFQMPEKIPVPLLKRTLKHIDKVLVVSPKLHEPLMRLQVPQQPEVVGNPVDADFFTPAPEWQPSDHPFTFTLIARLDQNKAVDVLLQAIALLPRRGALRFLIAGDGKKRQELEELANILGIQHVVQFLGWQSRTQIRDLIQHSHVVVSSSHVETFGITLIEALACGKPVVATRSGGPESFVNERNGLLVPVQDPAALAGAMQSVIENYSRFDAAQIRAECVQKFGQLAFVRRLENAYDSVINA
jgi:glycosyltransferase involved in cell wall biosynthesis